MQSSEKNPRCGYLTGELYEGKLLHCNAKKSPALNLASSTQRSLKKLNHFEWSVSICLSELRKSGHQQINRKKLSPWIIRFNSSINIVWILLTKIEPTIRWINQWKGLTWRGSMILLKPIFQVLLIYVLNAFIPVLSLARKSWNCDLNPLRRRRKPCKLNHLVE